jgi:hypothetical protein
VLVDRSAGDARTQDGRPVYDVTDTSTLHGRLQGRQTMSHHARVRPGRTPDPCQGEGRGFESRRPLHAKDAKRLLRTSVPGRRCHVGPCRWQCPGHVCWFEEVSGHCDLPAGGHSRTRRRPPSEESVTGGCLGYPHPQITLRDSDRSAQTCAQRGQSSAGGVPAVPAMWATPSCPRWGPSW